MYYPFHSQKEWIMKSCKVVLTFESVDEILWCYHSYETSSAVLSHGTINLVCSSNFWVCGWNPTVSQFKWHLFGRTFEWYYLFFSKRKFGAFVQFWTWSLLDTPCKPPPKMHVGPGFNIAFHKLLYQVEVSSLRHDLFGSQKSWDT